MVFFLIPILSFAICNVLHGTMYYMKQIKNKLHTMLFAKFMCLLKDTLYSNFKLNNVLQVA